MEKKMCCFLKIGIYGRCTEHATKHSNYCKLHNYRLKNNQCIVRPCLKCGNGTYARHHICCACGGALYRQNSIYAYKVETSRLRKIEY